jgi:heat shock protein HslJ
MGMVVALLLGGCSLGDGAGQGQVAPEALAATRWQDATRGAEPLTLVIAADGTQVSGYAGCNRFFGPARLGDKARLNLGPMATTRMACEPPRMVLEARFLQALESTRGWGMNARSLDLLDAQGQTLWSLQRMGP